MSISFASLRKALLITTPLMIMVATSVQAQDDLDPVSPPIAAATETTTPAPGERTITFEPAEVPSDDVPIGTTVHKGTDAATGSKNIEVTKTGEGKYRTVITSGPKHKKNAPKSSYND